MGLISDNQKRIFLGIANGKITHKTGPDTTETFSAVEGTLKSIGRRTVDIKGVATEFLDVLIEDGGQLYNLSTAFNGGTARSIILSLASIESFVGCTVRFTTFLSKDGMHSNVLTEVDGQRVTWVTKKIPPVKVIRVGSSTVKDDTDRMQFTDRFLTAVQQRLEMAAATPEADADIEGDLPDDDNNYETLFGGSGPERM